MRLGYWREFKATNKPCYAPNHLFHQEGYCFDYS